ncbi:MAG: protein-glutamate O-methyltransferase CheR, partial [Chloroflexota bacterium]
MERTEIDTYIPLIDYLKRARGLDLSGYKSAGLIRRINKRMSMVGIESLPDYIDYLEVHPEEFNLFFDTILINVTGFFRDPAAWEYLAKEIIPKILANRRKDEAFRAWSTGCATGEEAYSIAMLLSEAMGEDAYRDQVKIYATDIDDGALAKARSATYTEKDVQDIPPELREKYLVRSGSAYTLNKELRRSVIFGRNNLVNDAPISRVDLLVCRNTLMYFTAEMQSKILARFNFSLRDYGYLFLGKAEMLLTHSHLFIPADLKLRIFSKVPQFRNREHQAVTANLVGDKDSESINGAGRLRDAALESSPVAQVILNQNNQLVNANEKARNLLGIKTSDLGRPFQDLDFSFKPV